MTEEQLSNLWTDIRNTEADLMRAMKPVMELHEKLDRLKTKWYEVTTYQSAKKQCSTKSI